ncbi:MAG: tRNA uridine-5-carboxymethylaminomethyl(34) synthesis GTPase MnmE, partial [Opitutales bacterium]
MSRADTIVALATPVGEAAIGIVRVSGALCADLPGVVFKLPSPTPRVAHLATYHDIGGKELDQILFIYYEKGKSYTAQPSLEIFCHGNPLILRKVIDDLVGRGCRLAEPGEFTRLAFLSGKIELVQAEAVATLIRARSDRALEIANRHLRGETGKGVNRMIKRLLEIVAQLEVYVDFPHEDLPPEDVANSIEKMESLATEMAKAAETGKFAHLLDAGIQTLIVGEPNVGKSSLFNALCGKDRTIVSEEPGTTRDYVGERLHLGSFEVELIDTAGIRDEATGLELNGMERTLDLAKDTDFFLLTLDGTAPSPALPPSFLEPLETNNCIVINNKMDLGETVNRDDFLPEMPHVRTSALTGQGIESLKGLWEELLDNRMPSPAPDDLV